MISVDLSQVSNDISQPNVLFDLSEQGVYTWLFIGDFLHLVIYELNLSAIKLGDHFIARLSPLYQNCCFTQ